jgi:hypothetical protein
MTDGRYVTWDRWDAEHRALADRVHELEGQALASRVATLEQRDEAVRTASTSRRNRLWLITLAVMTGLVCPLIVTTIITLAHLRGGLSRGGRSPGWRCCWLS